MATEEPIEVPPATVDDLIADAHAMRLHATPRMVTDWIVHGLLDSPDHHGAGQGQGSRKGVFSSNQRQLFRALLRQRESVKRLALLAQVPIVLWAYWGDDYVSTRQARKALTTALESQLQAKERAAREAKQFVEQIAHPDANPTAVNRLRRLVVDAMTSGRIRDKNELDRTYRRVFDPHNHGRRVLPPGISTGISVSPSQIVGAAARQEYAIALFQKKDSPVTDAHLEATRQELQRSLVEYATHNPLYVALSGQRLVDVVTHHEFQQLTDGIVRNTFLVLGAILIEERRSQGRPQQRGAGDVP